MNRSEEIARACIRLTRHLESEIRRLARADAEHGIKPFPREIKSAVEEYRNADEGFRDIHNIGSADVGSRLTVRADAISLSDDELNDIFRQKVYPRIFSGENLSSVDNPEVLVLGGQPGSGKSFMVPDLLASFEGRGGAVYIGTADTFMKYLPRYDEIVRHDDTATHLLIDDAWKLMSKSVDHAIDNRYNVLLEQTLMNHRGAARMIDRFVERRYTATVKTLAVPPPESRLSTRTRYMEQRDTTGIGLLTPLEIHDAGVSGATETIRMLQSDNPPVKVNGLAVSSREGDLYHIQRDASGEWPEPPRAAETLETKRNEPLSAREARSFNERLGNFRDWVSRQARDDPLDAERWERLAREADDIEQHARPWVSVQDEAPSATGVSRVVDSGADSPEVEDAGQDSEGQ
ncbi:zeta toxin family protein [Nocardia sp. CA-084685]|uniref:zeta toxin family protein n=1 Tax=Nocardia sp. CA-084685 TaxID=3239970 RepID=UPI003D9602E5